MSLDLLNDKNYIEANLATKKAIFDKHIGSDPNYYNSNSATRDAIKQKYGVFDTPLLDFGSPAQSSLSTEVKKENNTSGGIAPEWISATALLMDIPRFIHDKFLNPEFDAKQITQEDKNKSLNKPVQTSSNSNKSDTQIYNDIYKIVNPDIDPNSEFGYNPEQLKSSLKRTNEYFEGLGITPTLKDGKYKLDYAPIKDQNKFDSTLAILKEDRDKKIQAINDETDSKQESVIGKYDPEEDGTDPALAAIGIGISNIYHRANGDVAKIQGEREKKIQAVDKEYYDIVSKLATPQIANTYKLAKDDNSFGLKKLDFSNPEQSIKDISDINAKLKADIQTIDTPDYLNRLGEFGIMLSTVDDVKARDIYSFKQNRGFSTEDEEAFKYQGLEAQKQDIDYKAKSTKEAIDLLTKQLSQVDFKNDPAKKDKIYTIVASLTDNLNLLNQYSTKLQNLKDTKLDAYKTFLANQETVDKLGAKYPVFDAVSSFGKELWKTGEGVPSWLDKNLNLSGGWDKTVDINGRKYENKEIALFKEKHLEDQTSQVVDFNSGELVNLSEASAIQIFNNEGDLDIKLSARPLFYEGVKTGVMSYVLGGFGSIAETSLGSLGKSILGKDLVAWSEGKVAEGAVGATANSLRNTLGSNANVGMLVNGIRDVGGYSAKLFGMVTPSVLLYGEQMQDSFIKQGFTVDQSFKLATLSGAIEGFTETIFGNEVRMFNNLTGKTIASKEAGEYFEKAFAKRVFETTGNKLGAKELSFAKNLFTYGKKFALSELGVGVKEGALMGLEESAEEIIGNLMTALIQDPIALSYKKDYIIQDNVSLKSMINTTVSTVATMLPTMGTAGVGGIKQNNIEALQAKYEVGLNPKLYTNSILDLLKNNKITEEEAQRRISLVSDYGILAKQAKNTVDYHPKFSNYNEDEKSKLGVSIFEQQLKKANLAKELQFVLTDGQRAGVLEEILKVDEGLNKLITNGLYKTEEERISSRNKFLSYFFNQDVLKRHSSQTKLNSLITSLEDEKSKETNEELIKKYDTSISAIETRISELKVKEIEDNKTPAQKAQDENAQGFISLDRPDGTVSKLLLNTPYHASTIKHESVEGFEIKERPVITILQANEDGTITISSDGEVSTINKEDLQQYKFTDKATVDKWKKDKDPKGFVLEHENDVFSYEFNSETDKRVKEPRGRIEYDEKTNNIIFKYKNKDGSIGVQVIPRNELKDITKGQFRYARTLHTQEQHLAKQAEIQKKLADLDLSKLESQQKRRWEFIKNFIEEKAQELLKTKELISTVEDSLLDIEIEMDKLQKQLDQKENTKTKQNKTRVDVAKLFDKLNTLQQSHKEIQDTLSQLEQQKEDLEKQIEYTKKYETKQFNEDTSLIDQLIDDQFDIELQLEQVNGVISKLKDLISGIEDTIKKIANTISNLILGFEKTYGKERVITSKEELDDLIGINREFVKSLGEGASIFKKYPEFLKNVEKFQELLSSNLDKLDLSEAEIGNLKKSIKANIDIAKNIQNKIRYQEELIEAAKKAEQSKKDTKKQEAIKKIAEKLFETDTSNFVDTSEEKVPFDEAYDPKVPLTKIATTTTTGGTENNPLPNQSVIDFQEFLNNVDDIKNYKIFVVTKDNAKNYGLEDIVFTGSGITNSTNNESDNDIVLVFVQNIEGTPIFVDKNGKPLSTPSKDKVVYTKMRKSLLSFGSENSKSGDKTYSFNGKPEDEKVLANAIEIAHKEMRQLIVETIASGGEVDLNISGVSRGHSYGEKTDKNSVLGTILPENFDLSSEQIIFIPKQSDPKKDTGEVVAAGDATTREYQKGRPVLNFKQHLAALKTKQFSPQEKEKFIKVFKYLYDNISDKKEFDRVFEYLKKTLYFRNPNSVSNITGNTQKSDVAQNQIWYDKSDNTLHFGAKNTSISFNLQESEKENFLTLQAFFDEIPGGFYHNIDYKESEKGGNIMMQPFEEFVDIVKGEIVTRQWKTYQEYLLSDKYPNGEKRPVDDIPLTTNVNKSEPNSPNTVGRYVIFENEFNKEVLETHETKEKITVPKVVENKNKYNFTPFQKDATIQSIGAEPGVYRVIGADNTYILKWDGKTVQMLSTTLKNADFDACNELFTNAVVNKTGVRKYTIDKHSDLKEEIPSGVLPTIPQDAKEQTKTESANTNQGTIEQEPTSPDASFDDSFFSNLESGGETSVITGTENRLAIAKNYKLIDIKKAELWWKDRFPQIPFRYVTGFINGNAFGTLYKGAVTISRAAEVGTEFHEAFEVFWKHFSTPHQMRRLIREFKNRKGTFIDYETKEVVEYAKATYHQIKENLAEEFRDYELSNGQIKWEGEFNKNSLFKRIFNAIRDFFLRTDSVEDVFKAISEGKFKNALPKNLELNNLSVENRLHQLKKNPTFFNDSMKTISYYLFHTLANKQQSIPEAILSKNFDDSYDEAKKDLEIFYNAQNLDRLLSIPKDVFVKQFSDQTFFDKLQPALSVNLRKAIRDYTNENKLTNQERALKLYDVLNSGKIILDNWNELVKLNKDYLSKYGVEFSEVEDESIEEENKTNEYTPEITKYNKKVNTNAEIKSLIAMLMAKKVNLVSNKLGVIRTVTDVKNSLLQPELVDFGAVFSQLLYRLAPTSTFEEMSEVLKKEAYNNPSLQTLVDKLELNTDEANLSNYTVDLRNKFYQSLNSMFVEYGNLLVNPDLTGSVIDVNDKKHLQQIKNKWTNNILGSGLITYTDTGKMKFDTSSLPKPTDINSALSFLNKLGFDFKTPKSRLNSKETIDVVTSASKLYNVVNSTEAPYIVDKNAALVRPYITALAEIEQKYNNEYFESQHINIEGEPVQNMLLNNFLGYITKAFNYSKSLEDFFKAIPQLNSDNKNNAFQKNSLILSKDGKFFDKEGNRKREIGVCILEGLQDKEGDISTHTSNLSISDMFAQEFAYNLEGTFSILTPADSRTPWGWNTGLFLTKEESKDNSKVLGVLKNYLIAEIETSRQDNVFNLKQLDGKKFKLRFFDGIITLDTNNDLTPEQLVEQNKDSIEKQFLDLIDAQVDKTVKFLEKENLIKDYVSTESRMISADQEPEYTISYVDKSHQPTGLSKSQIKDLVRHREINYMFNIIEQHKVMFGDPMQWKAATKRVKSYMSGRRMSINNAPYFDKHENKVSNTRTFINEKGEEESITLYPDDFAYHPFSDVIKVQTFLDVISISNALSSIKSVLKNLKDSEVDKYSEINEADAQAWSFFPGYREIRKRDTTWTVAEEELFLWDEANMFQDLLKEGIDLYPKDKRRDSFINYHTQLLAKGNPYINRLNNGEKLPEINVLKPIYSGFKNVDANIQNIDKMSTIPLTWSLVKDTNLKDLYIAHYKAKTHYVKMESANKIGLLNNIQPIYDNNGKANTTIKHDYLNFKYLGIQVETIGRKIKTTLGTQMTKLISSGLFNSNLPLDVNMTKEEWNNLSEDEKLNSSNYYKLAQRNHKLLSAMKVKAKKKLFEEFGISEYTKDNKKMYSFSNLQKLENLIQKEFKSRDVAENIKESIQVVVENGKEKFIAPLDAIIGAEKLEAIFTSIIDKAILRPKLKGGQLPQVSSALFEKNNRKAVYKDKGKWKTVKDFNKLTAEQKKTVRLSADTLKFYEGEDGKRYCEVILPYSFQKTLKQGQILSIDDIPEELRYGVGFRIPTQGHNSMENFKIKGFLPVEYGDAIIVPSEITVKAGSDFDIDKLNIYLYNYKLNKTTGKPEKIQFNNDLSESGVKTRYYDFIKSLVSDFKEIENDVKKDSIEYQELKAKKLSNLEDFREELKSEKEDLIGVFSKKLDEISEMVSQNKDASEEVYNQGYEIFKRLPKSVYQQFLSRNKILDQLVEDNEIQSFEKTLSFKEFAQAWVDNLKEDVNVEYLDKEGKTQVEQVKAKQTIKILNELIANYDLFLITQGWTVSQINEFNSNLEKLKENKEVYKQSKKDLYQSWVTEENKKAYQDFKDLFIKTLVETFNLPPIEEFKKLPIEQQNTDLAIENAYIDNIRDILQLPRILEQLLTPNSSQDLEDVAKDVRKLYKEEDKTTLPVSSYLSSLSNAETRYAYLVGKSGVSIFAKGGASHSIAMEIGLKFSTSELLTKVLNKSVFTNWGLNKAFNMSLPMNITENGDISLSDVENADKVNISSIISSFLDAFVDIANKPFISYINGNLTTAGTYLTGVRMGIPITYLGRFMSQPVIKDYIKLKQANKSVVNLITNSKLKQDDMIDLLSAKYGFTTLANDREQNYTIEELDSFITDQTSTEFASEQGKILGQYLFLEEIGSELFNFDQCFPDTIRTVSFESIRMKLYDIHKAQQGIFKDFVKPALYDTFLSDTIIPKWEILKALAGKSEDESLYITEKPSIRKYLNPLIEDIYKKYISREEKENLAKNIKRQLISYLIQTIPVSIDNSPALPLTSQIERLMSNVGDKNTIANRVRNLQFSLQSNPTALPNNMFVPNLFSIFPALSKGKVATIKLLRKPKDKIDTDSQVTDFSSLFERGATRNIAYDLVTTALLKSGVTYSPNSFVEVIPAHIFQDILTQVETYLNNPLNTEKLLHNFETSYVSNKANDKGLVTPVSGLTTAGKSRINNKIVKMKIGNYVVNLETLHYKVLKTEKGITYPYLSRDIYSKYLITTNLQINPETGELYTKKETEDMKKRGDYSFLKQTLWKKFEVKNPDTGTLDTPLAESEIFNSKWQSVVYFPIPIQGDRSNLLEHYPSLRTSQVNSFNLFPDSPNGKSITQAVLDKLNNLESFYLSQKIENPGVFTSFLNAELGKTTVQSKQFDSDEEIIDQDDVDTTDYSEFTQELDNAEDLTSFLNLDSLSLPQENKEELKNINTVTAENISSKGSEFAKKLTNVGNTVGLTYKGKQYVNSEHAYQTWKSGEFNQIGYDLKGGKVRGGKIGDTFSIMTDILTEKLKQHPELVQGINERGGLDYIEQSTHNVIGDKFWESSGQNKFIEALAQAYKNIENSWKEEDNNDTCPPF